MTEHQIRVPALDVLGRPVELCVSCRSDGSIMVRAGGLRDRPDPDWVTATLDNTRIADRRPVCVDVADCGVELRPEAAHRLADWLAAHTVAGLSAA